MRIKREEEEEKRAKRENRPYKKKVKKIVNYTEEQKALQMKISKAVEVIDARMEEYVDRHAPVRFSLSRSLCICAFQAVYENNIQTRKIRRHVRPMNYTSSQKVS